MDYQIEKLSREAPKALPPHQNALVHRAKAPGFGAESAQQMIAEVAVNAETFP